MMTRELQQIQAKTMSVGPQYEHIAYMFGSKVMYTICLLENPIEPDRQYAFKYIITCPFTGKVYTKEADNVDWLINDLKNMFNEIYRINSYEGSDEETN